jgi:hypothetical protein
VEGVDGSCVPYANERGIYRPFSALEDWQRQKRENVFVILFFSEDNGMWAE